MLANTSDIYNGIVSYSKRRIKMEEVDKILANENIVSGLEKAGYDYAVAVATEAELEAKSACGMLSIITELPEQSHQ
jgi:hypothetical protein